MTVFDEENRLVERVKLGDSVALAQLVEKYKPLIFRIMGQYQLHLYDTDDWLQEARIECYLTAQKFDASTGSRFGSFFKLRFQNSTISKVRQQMAQKRRSNCQAHSLDSILINKYDLLPSELTTEKDSAECVLADLEAYTRSLSFLEIQALLINLGKKTLTQTLEQYEFEEEALKNAQQRVRTKLRNHLRTEFGMAESKN